MARVNAGDDVDAYCGKCRLDLAHVVIAVSGVNIAKAQCKTCNSIHKYRTPTTDRSSRRGLTPTTTRRKSAAAATSAPNPYDQLMHGRDFASAKRYKLAEEFDLDDVLDHKKFGLGLVTKCFSGGKIEVCFQEGTKVLAHAR